MGNSQVGLSREQLQLMFIPATALVPGVLKNCQTWFGLRQEDELSIESIAAPLELSSKPCYLILLQIEHLRSGGSSLVSSARTYRMPFIARVLEGRFTMSRAQSSQRGIAPKSWQQVTLGAGDSYEFSSPDTWLGSLNLLSESASCFVLAGPSYREKAVCPGPRGQSLLGDCEVNRLRQRFSRLLSC